MAHCGGGEGPNVFDALTQKRPYKAAWSIADAVAEITRQRDRQFDPIVVDAFETLDPHHLLAPVESGSILSSAAGPVSPDGLALTV